MPKAIKVLAVLAVVLFCLQVFSDNKADVDLWGNVGFVSAMPWAKEFRYTNTYSFTEPVRPWINHEWLAEYILHNIYTRFGNAGLIIYELSIGILVTAILCLALGSAAVSAWPGFLWLLLTISVMGYGFSPRPHLLTYLFYALFLLILFRYKSRGSKAIYMLPILGVLWANLHGAFFIGTVLLAIFLVTGVVSGSRRAIPLTLITVLFVSATFINPYGCRLWRFIFYSAGIPRPFLSEWASLLNMELLAQHVDFIFLALASFSAIFFSRKPKEAAGLTALLVSFASAIAMRRNIPLFAITAVFVVPEYLEDVMGERIKRILENFSTSVISGALILFCTVSIAYTFYFNKADFREIEVNQKSFPVTAVSFMKENGISGNALIFFNWAEYAIWKMYPDCRVFLDGRLCSAYSVQTIDDFFNFLYLRKEWWRAITDYPTDIVLIHRLNPAYSKMLSMPGWVNIYNDKIAGLFLRKSSNNAFFSKLERGGLRYPELKKDEYFP